MRVLDSAQGTLALVPVTIGGHGPYLFALDTGASASVVDADIAEELSLPETGEQRPVTGIIGNQRVSLVHIGAWAAGGVTLDATDVARVDLPEPDRGQGLQGLLGSDVLSSFGSIRIDYDNARLHLGRP